MTSNLFQINNLEICRRIYVFGPANLPLGKILVYYSTANVSPALLFQQLKFTNPVKNEFNKPDGKHLHGSLQP